MVQARRIFVFLLAAAPWFPVGAVLTPEQRGQLPVPAAVQVEFNRDIRPILEARCVKCHGRGKANGGFSLENRVAALKGGDNGPAILPGQSAESYLVELVSGLDPDNVMPQKGSRLKPGEVALVRAWIDQGAAWDPGVTFAKAKPLNLEPRRPPVRDTAVGGAPAVDRILADYCRERGGREPGPVSDRTYARRVYLDVLGVLPLPVELDAFEADPSPDKRRVLVRRLLADRRRYAEHWLTFWNDALRNDYQGTGYIDGGRKQITGWLYRALADNLRYDEFVRGLVNPGPETQGFANGIVWRGIVNASQTPPMQAAQNVSQVFLGVNLKCASCHDSFINDWTLADAYGLAGVYAEEALEMVHCDKPTGRRAEVRFLYPGLGAIPGDVPKAERTRRLAELMTAETNGRLSRTMVNRLWAKFLGRGLVEPLDDMEQAAWLPDLLDWLAADLVEHGYDLKHTIELILTSEAYQLPAVPVAEHTGRDFVFRGPLVRRMTAEQYLDALAAVTGVWTVLPSPRAELAASTATPESPVTAHWIWTQPQSLDKAAPGTVLFRRSFVLAAVPEQAAVVAAADNRFKVFLNGREVTSGDDYQKPKLADARPHLVVGTNVLAVEATNDPGQPSDSAADQANPAGLIVHVWLRGADGGAPVEDVVSDSAWSWSSQRAEGWEKPDFAATGWAPAVELGTADVSPWKLGAKLGGALASASHYGKVRAALRENDALMAALGRPNREQVLTSRSSVATTLQALELTNGSTLAELLQRGAGRLAETAGPDAPELVRTVYRRALGRAPSAAELALGTELVGSPVQREGVEDLLWATTMLPEFQLIY